MSSEQRRRLLTVHGPVDDGSLSGGTSDQLLRRLQHHQSDEASVVLQEERGTSFIYKQLFLLIQKDSHSVLNEAASKHSFTLPKTSQRN